MIPQKNILILLGLGLLAISTVGILSFSLIETKQAARSLKKQLEYLENNIESAKQKNLQKLDSLQEIIVHQEHLNDDLKKTLSDYQQEKQINDHTSNENKAAIYRIHSTDSLYRRSQDTTDKRPVTFPFWMAKEIALDLEEKSRLETNEKITSLELATLTSLIESLEKSNQNRNLQIELLKSNNKLHQQQLTTSKLQKSNPGTFTWILRLMACFSLGYLIGNF